MDWLKKHRVSVLINLGLVFLSALCVFGYFAVSNTLNHIDSSKKWQGENELSYAYISCFMPVNEKIDENAVYSFEKAAEESFIQQIGNNEGEKAWNYAYSGTGMVTASTERGSVTVNATGIGGDFFFFHSFYLRSGNYISGSDLMKDKVVIDKELAWSLFGATEVAGMELLINGSRYIVAGVIEPDSDFASKAAKTENGGLYMAFEKLAEETGAGIECYEAVLPNPVKNYAINLINEKFPSENCSIIEVDKRYSIGNIAKIIGSFGERSMRVDGIVFPEWENAARLTEDYCTALFVFAVIFGMVPVVFGVVLAYKNAKTGSVKLKTVIKEKAHVLSNKYNDMLYEREKSLNNKTRF
ncbi:MAG: ABC transporter permease [Oscillospiraceae bacterium]|nr:ABC transporter permease [Oscillospiraceae bacterium]